MTSDADPKAEPYFHVYVSYFNKLLTYIPTVTLIIKKIDTDAVH